MSDGSEDAAQEDALSVAIDPVEKRAAWLLFPNAIPKVSRRCRCARVLSRSHIQPAEMFPGYDREDGDDDARTDVDEEDDSDYEDNVAGNVRDLFASLGIPISLLARIEEEKLTLDDLTQMNNGNTTGAVTAARGSAA